MHKGHYRVPADSAFPLSPCAENAIFCRTARPLSLEKKLSRATRGTAHLAPFPQMPDSAFLGMFFAENIVFTAFSEFQKLSRLFSFQGAAVAPPTQISRTCFFAENIVFYNIFCFPEAESSLSRGIPGCRPTQLFRCRPAQKTLFFVGRQGR